MEMPPDKSEMMAFLGQDPLRCKIMVDNKCLQVKNFKCLSCEVLYENENDIQQKITKFAPILGIVSNTFKPNLVQKFSRKRVYVVLPKISGNLNRAPKPVVICPSAARCG